MLSKCNFAHISYREDPVVRGSALGGASVNLGPCSFLLRGIRTKQTLRSATGDPDIFVLRGSKKLATTGLSPLSWVVTYSKAPTYT